MTTFTVDVHRGSADADGQLLPGAVVAAVRVMTCPPAGHGLATRIPPVIVTVAPTGTSPLHTAPPVPTDIVPELAVSLPTSLIWSAVFGVVRLTLIPLYGVCPVLVIVVVSFTVVPGVTVPALGVDTIVSCDTVTVAVHRGPVPPAGQLLPGVVEVTVLARTCPPVSGLLTVTE